VNPDEVVAVGAAIQGGVLSGEVKDVLLLDVTPLTLGVETLGGVMTPLIERNTTIPVRKTETFTTAEDGQTVVTIHVLQGERTMAADNISLGQFNLEGIPPAPRGVPQIEVTFDIDANGILHVSAKDKATGKEQEVTITAATTLTEEQVEERVREARRHEAEDRQRRELVQARNEADAILYQTEKMLRDMGDQISGADRQRIEDALEQLREAKDKDDTARIRQLIEQLQQASYAIGQQMYAQQQDGGPQAGQGRPGGGGEEGKGGEEGVVEGEFREV
jgi:molecular chaperone DnaK